MIYTEQEIATMVAKKCEEALAPLYAQMKELEIAYGMRKPDPHPTDPTTDPEEVEALEMEKQRKHFEAMADNLRKQGLIK